ncbi:MAG: FGGY-family carbohydrate kinase [Lachnospiraceae bacterium]|nr:FGGY-family carbohydrate kinase [Lachnospiraceae bacterium]
MEHVRQLIVNGQVSLGIEFGSTRIKAVLVDDQNNPIASGGYDWENRFVNQVWTYNMDDIWAGLTGSYQDLVKNVQEKYDCTITTLKALGVSGMMHGYLVLDKEERLLTPFRTWRNTFTEKASLLLFELFHYNVPQRFSASHLLQAILNGEAHVKNIDYMTTLAGFIHWKLTGEKVMGVGEASGMFPIDSETKTYNEKMLKQFDELIADKGYPWKLEEILPKVMVAGEMAGSLTEAGARLLDPSGNLQAGTPLCPPEGDAGTGMVATNSVAVRTGNVSAGTSIFAMIVLEHALSRPYEEIDMVTTPAGDLVAMVHCNNCTSDLNAWVGLFEEFADAAGFEIDKTTLFKTLYEAALKGDADGGGLLAYNYYSGEHITGFEEGRPLFVRTPDAKFNLANFMRVHLFTALGAMKTGMNILQENEHVHIDQMLGHGGLFRTKGVGQKVMAAAINSPVVVMETAGEGGAWGIAVLASYMVHKKEGEDLTAFLADKVFADEKGKKEEPCSVDVAGFETFFEKYKKGLPIERAAIDFLK